MEKLLVTGAAGGVGTRLRKLMKGLYPSIRWSDLRKPGDLAGDEDFMAADLADLAAVEKIVAGVEGIVHLGGYSVEGPWDTILQVNIIGTYNLFEAARRAGVKRVVFASSNHAVGFYPRDKRIGINVPVRPDSRYGVSKAFGEALGALYAEKHGIRVTCLRIGNVGDAPADRRRLAIWLKPEDLVALIRIGLEHATRSSTASPTMPTAGGTTAMPAATATNRKARPAIPCTRRWPRKPRCRPIRSATAIRAARSAATNMTQAKRVD